MNESENGSQSIYHSYKTTATNAGKIIKLDEEFVYAYYHDQQVR